MIIYRCFKYFFVEPIENQTQENLLDSKMCVEACVSRCARQVLVCPVRNVLQMKD